MTARLVIAAPASGEGKTSVALGLGRALRKRRIDTALAKVGPDYLDTGWQALASGNRARNLDVWTMGERGVAAAMSRASEGADVVIVEGVMGLHDGHRTGAAACSTADVARLLDAPVVIVIDASGAAATLAAVGLGLSLFDPAVRVAGVILNRFGEHRERRSVKDAFATAGLPVLGWIPRIEDAELPSRHLGLVQAEEERERGERAIDALAEAVERYCDVDELLRIARSAAPLPTAPPTWATASEPAEGVRIGIARDNAFAFYYADNLEALQELGAELVEFSPLDDPDLPSGIDGVYFGGGYPEVYAEGLSANASMLESVRRACTAGLPTYAECGGMLYLLDSLTDGEGRRHDLAGVLPATACMTPKLQRLGYVEAQLAHDCMLGEAGTRVRGHEFRYSTCEPAAGETAAWMVDCAPKGFSAGNVFASYLHLNFAGCPRVAENFVAACRRSRIGRNR